MKGAPRGQHTSPDGIPPVGSENGRVDLTNDDLNHSVEQVLLVGDVFVQRHGHDAQLLCESAHAQRIDADLIREGDCRLEHSVAVQPCSPLDSNLLTH